MRILLVPALVAGALLVAPAPAHAAPYGQPCDYLPFSSAGAAQTGWLYGGPIGDDTFPTAAITLRCSIQTGGTNSLHFGPDAVVLTGNGDGTATIPPTLVSFVSEPGQPFYVCTQVTVDNFVTYFWDAVSETWSSSNVVPCAEGLVVGGPPVPTQCRDGLDNDLDGATDHPADPDCASADDPLEAPVAPPQCGDGLDNDGDFATDFPADPDCESPADPAEAPQCRDGVDNDLDGTVDYPADSGCTHPDDPAEATSPCPPSAPGVVVCLVPGGPVLSQPVNLVTRDAAVGHTVLGYVQAYDVTVAEIELVLPCVVLVVDGSPVDPCGQAGGAPQPGSSPLVLVDETLGESTLATVRVCTATLTVTVLGFGVGSAPAFALC